MLLMLGGAVLIAAGAAAVVVSRRPDNFAVTRSAVLAASPDVVFPHVNDLRKWDAWSPWAKLDPNAKYTFGPETTGTGAWTTWDGNGKVGAGRMTILESRDPSLIRLELEFIRPFKATSTTEITFEAQGTGTRATWSMSGTNSFLGKAVGLVMNCDRMMGAQFEEALRNLGDTASTARA